MSDAKKKAQARITKQNVLESLKDIGGGVTQQGADLLKTTSEDFFKELLGLSKAQPKRSGDITPGQSLEMSSVMSGKEEENKKLRAQISMERQLANDEKRVAQEKTNQLKVQLQALTSEIQKVAVSTQNFAEQAQISMIQAPANPGIYHVTFFENVLEFLRSFRKRIDDASAWLMASNKRSEKKNYWSTYKKKGSSFLLSPDHYLQRSAG